MRTAVEWLVEQLKKTTHMSEDEFYMYFKKAKEMEKEQIIEARNDIQKKCISVANKFNDGLFEFNEYEAEQYYNETFKSE